MATIREVAKHAGVSVATVSRVYNESGPVNKVTRARVLASAKTLQFVPNRTARSLSIQKTDTFGILLPDLHGPFFSELLRGMNQLVRQHRYHLMVSSLREWTQDLPVLLRSLWGRVDAMVIMASEVDLSALETHLMPDLPVVLINGVDDTRMEPTHSLPYDVLSFDNRGGAQAMVEHLIGLGHRRIATIRGPDFNADAEERLRGYEDALSAAGLPFDPNLVLPAGFTEPSGYVAAQRLLAMEDRPTAVFAANDEMGIGAVRAFREAGLDVPGDISVGGFDDIPIANYITPALTTMRVPIYELGAQAIQRLFTAATTPEEHQPRRDVLPVELVLRDSCGSPPRAPG